MDHIVSDRIPVEKMQRFHEILISTGGRYVRSPTKVGGIYLVDYAPGDYAEQSLLWTRYVTPIREKRRDQRWRQVLRRLHLPF